MGDIYKLEKNKEKKQVINSIYNLMNLSDNRMVIIINNNILPLVMNETDI